MSEVLIKQGNTAVLETLVKDADGNTVTTLAQASEILFKVKEKKSLAVAKITKTKGDGIAVNTPETGYLQITLTPTDTEIDVKTYFMGLQIKWDADTIYELDLTIKGIKTVFFRIEGDIV